VFVLSVCPSVGNDRRFWKTADQIDTPFGVAVWVIPPRNDVLDESPVHPRYRGKFGEKWNGEGRMWPCKNG